jgi:fatty-acyl-CoA synthase
MPLRFADAAPEAYAFPLTIGHLLDGVVDRSGDQQIVYRTEVVLTYRQLIERIGRLASVLSGVGVREGTTVAVMDWDSHRYLEAYFAVPMMGAVLQTVNIRMPPAQIGYTLSHAQAEVVVVHRDFFPVIEALLPSLPRLRALIVIADGASLPVPAWGAGEYEDLLASAAPDFPFHDFDENAIATTFYTTGTTGEPKGVSFSHRQLVLHSLVVNAPFGSTGELGCGYQDVYMPLTPMFHVHAWGMPYVATMRGMKQVYPGRYEPELICRLRRDHNVTYSHCVPTILEMVIEAADRSGTDLTGWLLTIGGSALTSTLAEAAWKRGMRVLGGYGMSETAPLIAIARRRAGEEGNRGAEIETLTSMVPAPLVSARVVDEDMNDLPHDGVARGELVVRAPWLTASYTGDEAASAALWRGGWMHTQDLATMDPDGYLRIRDRLKDVIKTGGEWIDSLAVEELLVRAEGVHQIAVIASPDARWGERPLAVVVPEPGTEISLERLNAELASAIEAGMITRYAKLDRFVLSEALPLTSVGKVDKKLLRQQFATAG